MNTILYIFINSYDNDIYLIYVYSLYTSNFINIYFITDSKSNYFSNQSLI